MTSGCTGPRNALDLWHPTAAPRRRLGFGRAAPTPDGPDAGEAVDIAVIAPDADEVSRPWLEQAISRAAARLAADAVLWVIVPRRWRRSAERMLNGFDLVLLDAVLTVPPWPHTAHLIPVAPTALRYAAPRHLQVPAALTASLTALARGDPARAALRRTVRGCGLVAGRNPMAAPLRWLGEIDGAEPVTATATLGPRRDTRVAVVMRFTEAGPRPDVAVKVALDEGGAERLRREREALEALGAEAQRAGAAVPSPRPTTVPWLLATDALDGHPASALLAARADRLEGIALTVAVWLETWSVATAWTCVASADLLDQMLLAPARRVGESSTGFAGYLEVLRSLAKRIEGQPLTLVAAHNDLTVSNILVSRDGCGIVDWESAVAAGLPLLDLWYLLADALARARCITHARAVEALVRRHPPAPIALARFPARYARALALSFEQALLGFHACWLHHASNEVERGITDGPLCAVVRRVAAQRLLWPENGEPPVR